jgi:hypothetical protein
MTQSTRAVKAESVPTSWEQEKSIRIPTQRKASVQNATQMSGALLKTKHKHLRMRSNK